MNFQAKKIDFNPLREEDVTLPEGVAFVISNCCVEKQKAATSDFNTRVVECRLAMQVNCYRYFPLQTLQKLNVGHTVMNK
jgi:galactokinase